MYLCNNSNNNSLFYNDLSYYNQGLILCNWNVLITLYEANVCLQPSPLKKRHSVKGVKHILLRTNNKLFEIKLCFFPSYFCRSSHRPLTPNIKWAVNESRQHMLPISDLEYQSLMYLISDNAEQSHLHHYSFRDNHFLNSWKEKIIFSRLTFPRGKL